MLRARREKIQAGLSFKGLKMELSIKQKESIIKMFNEYLMQYKEAGIAHNEAVIFARHKTRQNASVMINTYFK